MQPKVDKKMKMRSLFFDKCGVMFDENVVFLLNTVADLFNGLNSWAVDVPF